MSIRRPSPAMVVACVALFVALGGTSFAAVNYARNASHVDGKNAFKSSRSRDAVAGDLVATYPGGHLKGQIANKHLGEVPLARSFARAIAVTDNASSAPVTLVDTGDIGTLTATCRDQAPKAGIVDPTVTLSFTNNSGQAVQAAKRIGVAPAEFAYMANGTVQTLTIKGSNTFEYRLGLGSTETLIDGAVRQLGARSTSAQCTVFGTSMQVGS